MHGMGFQIRIWIGNRFHNHKQRVVVNGVRSELLPVTSGDLLGSVLGPALFVTYINDIDVDVSFSVLRVADDTKPYSNVCTCNQTDHLQHDLDEMSE